MSHRPQTGGAPYAETVTVCSSLDLCGRGQEIRHRFVTLLCFTQESLTVVRGQRGQQSPHSSERMAAVSVSTVDQHPECEEAGLDSTLPFLRTLKYLKVVGDTPPSTGAAVAQWLTADTAPAGEPSMVPSTHWEVHSCL